MNIEQQPWLDLYHAALLEVDPEKLRQRITDATTAIHMRIEVLMLDSGGTAEERQALSDAMRTLNSLRRMYSGESSLK
ncbi:MAG TPA: hypothetical protein VFA74_03345 [Terriglobales bacterium]|nr:hypothetical protein [Terriglobales bacterium]